MPKKLWTSVNKEKTFKAKFKQDKQCSHRWIINGKFQVFFMVILEAEMIAQQKEM